MASPLGHGLAGYCVYLLGDRRGDAVHRDLAIRCVVAGILPDLDFVPGILVGAPALYHQGPSHSVLAGVIVAFLLASIPGCRDVPRGRVWALLAVAYLSHLAIDLVGPDRRPPYGIPLLW